MTYEETAEIGSEFIRRVSAHHLIEKDQKMTVTPDPTKEDLWITPLMGPAHLFRAGHSVAECGRNWIFQAWDGSRRQPYLDLCCPKCVEKAREERIRK